MLFYKSIWNNSWYNIFSTNSWIHYIVFKIVWKSNIYYSPYLCTDASRKNYFVDYYVILFFAALSPGGNIAEFNGPLFLYFMIVCMYNWISLHGLFYLSFLFSKYYECILVKTGPINNSFHQRLMWKQIIYNVTGDQPLTLQIQYHKLVRLW